MHSERLMCIYTETKCVATELLFYQRLAHIIISVCWALSTTSSLCSSCEGSRLRQAMPNAAYAVRVIGHEQFVHIAYMSRT